MLFYEAVDNLAYRFGKSDDEPFKARLARDLSVARAEILRRELNKKGSISSSHSNALTNIEIVESNLPYNNAAPSKKKVWRSKTKIPRPIGFNSNPNPNFTFVGSIDYITAHLFVLPERLTYRTTHFKDSQCYTYFDEYIFFFDNIKYFSVRAIFADIIAMGEVRDKDNKVCIPELTISDDLFTGMKRLLLEEETELALKYKPEVEVNEDQP